MEIEYHIKDIVVRDINNQRDVVVEVTLKGVHILPNTSSISVTKTLPIDFVEGSDFTEFESLTKEQVLSFVDKTPIVNEIQEQLNNYGKKHKIPRSWE
jgi:hypothetical protein